MFFVPVTDIVGMYAFYEGRLLVDHCNKEIRNPIILPAFESVLKLAVEVNGAPLPDVKPVVADSVSVRVNLRCLPWIGRTMHRRASTESDRVDN